MDPPQRQVEMAGGQKLPQAREERRVLAEATWRRPGAAGLKKPGIAGRTEKDKHARG
jgi:hypothetical protein